MSYCKDKASDSEEISEVSSKEETHPINISYLSPPDSSSMNLTLFPHHLLEEMQSSLPPDQIKALLNEQAEVLEKMVQNLESPSYEEPKNFTFHKEDVIDRLRGDVSKRVIELEMEQRGLFTNSFGQLPDDGEKSEKMKDNWEKIQKNKGKSREKAEKLRKNEKFYEISQNDEKKTDRVNNSSPSDLNYLIEELQTVKTREQSTFILLQKAHHQMRMIESQLLESQRKYYFELEKMTFDNLDLRRRLEESEFEKKRLQQENNFLKAETLFLKSQFENLDTKRMESDKFFNAPDYRRNCLNNDKNAHKRGGSEKETYTNLKERHFKSDEIRQPSRNQLFRPNTNNGVLTTPEKKNIQILTKEDLLEKLELLREEYNQITSKLKEVKSYKPINMKKREELETSLIMCENKINSITSRIKRIDSLASS